MRARSWDSLRPVSHSKKNLKDVKDSAPEFGFDAVQEAHFAGKQLDAEDTGLSYHVVKAGQRQGFAHRHDKAEEIYVILSGEGRIKLDDDVEAVGPMDAIRVAPHVARAFEASEDAPLEILAFGPRHDKDGEVLEGDFWGTAA
jgi:mannose-6-phosphate isomerase-like protein (cupin superfamily)